MTKKNVVISVICLEIICIFSIPMLINNIFLSVAPEFISGLFIFHFINIVLPMIFLIQLYNKINAKLTDWYFG